MNHLTLGIYSNGQYKFNVVRDEDLRMIITFLCRFHQENGYRLVFIQLIMMSERDAAL